MEAKYIDTFEAAKESIRIKKFYTNMKVISNIATNSLSIITVE